MSFTVGTVGRSFTEAVLLRGSRWPALAVAERELGMSSEVSIKARPDPQVHVISCSTCRRQQGYCSSDRTLPTLRTHDDALCRAQPCAESITSHRI
jgi:hypothetical protein